LGLALLAVALGLSAPALAARLEDRLQEQKAQSRRIDRELKAKKQAISRVSRQQRSTAQDLKTLDRELAAQGRRLAELERERRICEADYGKAKADLARLLPQVCWMKDSLRERLVLLADAEPQSVPAALFAPEHPSRAAETSLYLERLIQANAHAVECGVADAERLKASQQALERQRLQLASLSDQVAAQRDLIERKQAQKATLLASLGQRKLGYQVAARELEESSRAIRRLIEDLERKLEAAQRHEPGTPAPQVSTGFAALKGTLPPPAQGRVMANFGKPDSFGIISSGVDIESAAGAPITCVGRGRVAYAGMLKGYGKLIIIDHGDGYYTLYGRAAQLSKSEGQRAERGEVLGNAAGNGVALYFEIRHHRKPQNPVAWLARSVAAGAR
jgi:septal ring factor EnvC (AmiA/AmiB activator)